jgi:uncharacterized membrane protein HdeD (DUF308 family)
MDTVSKHAEKQLSRMRWVLGINGALSVALGVAIIVWPSISLYSLVIVFGAYALARGIVGIVAAVSGPTMPGRGWLVVSSLASIAVGVLVLFNTQMSALALLYVIGAYAIALGIIAVGGAFWLPLDSGDSVLLAVTGVVSILFGIVMFAEPGNGALVLLGLIAAYALIIGITELAVAIGGERLVRSQVRRYEMTGTSQASH